MAKLRVGVVGASGYSGAVAARLVAQHPGLVLAFATSDKLRGTRVAAQLAMVTPGDLRFEANGDALEARRGGRRRHPGHVRRGLGCASRPSSWSAGSDVVDLSGAFRLESAATTRAGTASSTRRRLGSSARTTDCRSSSACLRGSPHPGQKQGPDPPRPADRQPRLLPDRGAARPRAAAPRGARRARRASSSTPSAA